MTSWLVTGSAVLICIASAGQLLALPASISNSEIPVTQRKARRSLLALLQAMTA